jgi:tetratricopeptide (TPR) repeat protein
MGQTKQVADINGLVRMGYWPAVADGFFAEGKYSKAVDLCRRMLDLEPNVVSGRVVLGKSLYHAGRFGEAREQFIRVLRMDAANLVALKYLGDILYRDGEEAAALAYYRRILEIDPCCRGISCSIQRPDPDTTRQLTLKRPPESAEKKPRSTLREPAFITETVGDIYRDQGYLRLARDVYRRLLDRSGNSRIAEKLRDTEEKLHKKDGQHETTNR